MLYGLISLCLVNQGSHVRFSAPPSLSGETLSCGPVFLDALRPEPLPVAVSKNEPRHVISNNVVF